MSRPNSHDDTRAAARPFRIAAGDGDKRRGQPHDPRDGGKQRKARPERQRQPDLPRPRLLLQGQPPDEDREKDQVVDAEHDLQQRERQQACPNLWIQ